MASRKKMRKIAQYGINVGMGKPEHREELEAVLKDCRNPKVRQQLRARILRGTVAALALFGLMACASVKRVTTYTPAPPPKPEVVITNRVGKELLRITTDGKTWTWSDKPEAVILELISDAENLKQQLAAAKVPTVVKSTETAK